MLTPETANQLNTPTPTNWLIGAWHRPGSFALVLVAFSSMNLTAPITLAQLTPGANGAGYPVAEEILYFHHGHLSSTSLVTDAQANQVSLVNYEPYGEVTASSEGEDAFRAKFTGKEFDSNSELYYFGSRYYDAHLGRFLTPDPARQYFSPYIYGNGDPLGGIDPNGEFFISLTVLAIGAAMAGGAFMGGAAVNNSMNPASWDWSDGKTWAGIIGGAAIGGVTAGAGLAVTGAVAAAGWGAAATAAANMAIAGGVLGTMNASFTAMSGGSAGDIASAFGIGFGMGAAFAVPYAGPAALRGIFAYDVYSFASDPSVGHGIQLGMDIMFAGMARGMRLRQGGKSKSKEADGCMSCPCSSFAAETEVLSSEGEKAIEEVAVGDKPMNAGKLPFLRRMTQPMTYWIVMNIITILGKISFISNQMFPKPTLPKIFLLPFLA
nr:RHS repeat-associated core domain-containing protein [Pleurocapsa sp. PCC 7319]